MSKFRLPRFFEDDPMPRKALPFEELRRLKIKGFKQSIRSIPGEFSKKFTVRVPDPKDVTWRQEKRPRRTIEKIIDYSGQKLTRGERTAVISSILKSKNTDSGKNFDILGLELLKVLDTFTKIKNLTDSEINIFGRAIKSLDFIDPWNKIFPARFMPKSTIQEQLPQVVMYLLGDASFPLSISKPLFDVTSNPVSIRALGDLPNDYWIDIQKKQLMTKSQVNKHPAIGGVLRAKEAEKGRVKSEIKKLRAEQATGLSDVIKKFIQTVIRKKEKDMSATEVSTLKTILREGNFLSPEEDILNAVVDRFPNIFNEVIGIEEEKDLQEGTIKTLENILATRLLEMSNVEKLLVDSIIKKQSITTSEEKKMNKLLDKLKL